MPTKSDAFAEKFRELLKQKPRGTLRQSQDAYRQVIFLMGMQILEQFEKEAIAQIGRPPEGPQVGPHDGEPESEKDAANPAIGRGGGHFIVHIDSRGGGSGGPGNPSYLRPCGSLFPDYPLALQEITDSGRNI